MGEILAPGAGPVLAEFQIADEVEPEAVVPDRDQPVINPDVRDQPACGVEDTPPGQPVTERLKRILYSLISVIYAPNNATTHA